MFMLMVKRSCSMNKNACTSSHLVALVAKSKSAYPLANFYQLRRISVLNSTTALISISSTSIVSDSEPSCSFWKRWSSTFISGGIDRNRSKCLQQSYHGAGTKQSCHQDQHENYSEILRNSSSSTFSAIQFVSLKVVSNFWQSVNSILEPSRRNFVDSSQILPDSTSSPRPRFRRHNSDRRNYHHNGNQSSSGGSNSKRPYFIWAGFLTGPWYAFKHNLHLDRLDLQENYQKRLQDAKKAKETGKTNDALNMLESIVRDLQTENTRDGILAKMKAKEMMADIYLEDKRYTEAESLLLELFTYLIRTEKKSEDDSTVVLISIKLAELFAAKGELEKAEIGFIHLIEKQGEVVARNKVAFEKEGFKTLTLSEEQGVGTYADPEALHGMIFESFGNFLLKYTPAVKKETLDAMLRLNRIKVLEDSNEEDEEDVWSFIKDKDERWKLSRLEKAKSCIAMACHYATKAWGIASEKTILLLYNFGILALKKKHYEIASKCLEEVARRSVYNMDLTENLPAMYCNYAESLFHVKQHEKALEIANRAEKFAREIQGRPDLLEKVLKFKAQLARDARIQKK